MFSCWWASTCTASRPFLLLSLSQQCVYWECTTGLEGLQLEYLTPISPEGYSILYVIMLSDKSWGKGKKEEEATFIVTAFVFPSNYDTWWSPTFLETAERLPAMRRSEWIPSFDLLEHATFAFPCLFKTTSFCIFTLPIPSPTRLEGVSEQLCGLCLSARVIAQHLYKILAN